MTQPRSTDQVPSAVPRRPALGSRWWPLALALVLALAAALAYRGRHRVVQVAKRVLKDGAPSAPSASGAGFTPHGPLKLEGPPLRSPGEVDDDQRHPAPIAKIYMVAPSVVCVVLDDFAVRSFSEDIDWEDDGVNEVQGDDGPSWQAGPWKLARGSGKALRVVSVHRDTVPVGSNYSDYGWGKLTYAHWVDLQHQIYLVLEEPLGTRESLHITGPNGLDYTWQYDDAKVRTPVIQVNQVGYAPSVRSRFAYVGWWIGDGGNMSLADFPAEAMVNGRAVPLRRMRADSELDREVAQIDLGGVAPTSDLQIRIPGVGVSFRSRIDATGVMLSYYIVMRGLFHNRFGRDTRAEVTDWVRPRDDQRKVWLGEETDWNKKFPPNTPKQKRIPFVGGHHDAGDFDVRFTHHQVAMLLMEAYELHPAAHTDGQLTIPESGNRIPDLLDEVLYSLSAWEQLQGTDGGVRLGVEATGHPHNLVFADDDPMDYWTYAVDARHTIRVAGLFAQAARLVKPFDAARAKGLQERALRAYKYARAHGIDDQTLGPVMFACGELWRLTQEPEYKACFERLWNANVSHGKYAPIYPRLLSYGMMFDKSEKILGEYVLGYLRGPGADPVIVQQARRRITELADDAVVALQQRSYRHGRRPGSKPSWGVDTAAYQWVLPCAWALALGLDNPSYTDAISLARDYALGTNALGYSWFTGLGSRHPRDPRHADSRGFRLKDRQHPEVPAQPAMPGIPVYGPVSMVKKKAHYEYASRLTHPPFDDRPAALRYADHNFFISTNEHDVVQHSIQAAVMALLLPDGMKPDPAWLPRKRPRTP